MSHHEAATKLPYLSTSRSEDATRVQRRGVRSAARCCWSADGKRVRAARHTCICPPQVRRRCGRRVRRSAGGERVAPARHIIPLTAASPHCGVCALPARAHRRSCAARNACAGKRTRVGVSQAEEARRREPDDCSRRGGRAAHRARPRRSAPRQMRAAQHLVGVSASKRKARGTSVSVHTRAGLSRWRTWP